MTPKVMLNFVIGLPWFITPKGQRVIRGRHDLRYDPTKDHGDLCERNDLVYYRKRSHGH